MKTRVLDSWAVLEWLNGRTRAGNTVAALLAGAEAGESRLLMSLPATIEVPTMNDIWAAALLKGDHPVSYADAFAAALAKKHNCPLVTGDPELRSIKHLDLDWIGPRM